MLSDRGALQYVLLFCASVLSERPGCPGYNCNVSQRSMLLLTLANAATGTRHSAANAALRRASLASCGGSRAIKPHRNCSVGAFRLQCSRQRSWADRTQQANEKGTYTAHNAAVLVTCTARPCYAAAAIITHNKPSAVYAVA
jgi:hypothetical protein